jgi:hypothetical protein
VATQVNFPRPLGLALFPRELSAIRRCDQIPGIPLCDPTNTHLCLDSPPTHHSLATTTQHLFSCHFQSILLAYLHISTCPQKRWSDLLSPESPTRQVTLLLTLHLPVTQRHHKDCILASIKKNSVSEPPERDWLPRTSAVSTRPLDFNYYRPAGGTV